MQIIDFGISDYAKILSLQEELFQNLIRQKKTGEHLTEYLLIGEHQPVITVGRRGKDENILFSAGELSHQGIGVYHVGRGGDVTFHSPGQLVVYPIIDLEKRRLGVKDYVYLLEETVIKLLRDYVINGERIEGATGVWIGKGTTKERKISAIGIKCSRFCTMHGISINITNDLKGFSLINPCGFKEKGVTSLKKELLKTRYNTEEEQQGEIFPDLVSEVKEKIIDLLQPDILSQGNS